MGKHIVKVVEDSELDAEPGWAMACSDDGETLVFIVRRSMAARGDVLSDAWDAARKLENELLAEDLRRTQEAG